MRKRGRFRDSTYIKFLRGYVLVVLLVSLLFLPVFAITVRTVEENTVKDNQLIANNKVIILDNHLTYLHGMAVSLRNNSNIALLANVKGDVLSLPDHYLLYNSSLYMRNTLMLPDMAHSAYFFFSGNSILISRSVLAEDARRVYGGSIAFRGYDYDAWRAFLSFGERPVFKEEVTLVLSSLYETAELRVIPYVIPASNGITQRSDSALLCLLYADALEELLVGDGMDYRYALLTDKYGETVFSLGAPAGESAGRDAIEIVSQASNNGLRLTLGIDRKAFSRQFGETILLVTAIFLSSFTLGLVISAVLSYFNNAPIKRLKQTLQAVSPLDSPDNVYNHVEEALENLSHVNRIYGDEIRALEQTVRGSLMDRLLGGAPLGEEDERAAQRYLPFLGEAYVCAVINIRNSLLESLDYTSQVYSQTSSVLLADMAGRNVTGLACVHNILYRRLVLILSVAGEEEGAWRERVERELRAVVRDYRDMTGERVLIGVSRAGERVGDLGRRCGEAWDSLRVAGADAPPVLFARPEAREGPPLEMRDVQKLYELAASGDCAGAEDFLDRVLDRLLRQGDGDDRHLSRVYHSLLNAVTFAEKSLPRREGAPGPGPAYSPELTARELIANLKDYIRGLWGPASDRKQDRAQRLMAGFRDCVERRYRDPNLSAGMIADSLGISEKYLYAFVKGQSGRSVGEIIEETRMQKAMALLAGTERTVAEISAACGFNSQNTFYKAFRRYAGVSPGVWRQNRRQL